MDHEIYDGVIVECSVGEIYTACHFFDCQLIGVDTKFVECVFTNCVFDMHGSGCAAIGCFFVQCGSKW
jgi:hypothetical protein